MKETKVAPVIGPRDWLIMAPFAAISAAFTVWAAVDGRGPMEFFAGIVGFALSVWVGAVVHAKRGQPRVLLSIFEKVLLAVSLGAGALALAALPFSSGRSVALAAMAVALLAMLIVVVTRAASSQPRAAA